MLRDQLDAVWFRLSSEEQEVIRELSAARLDSDYDGRLEEIGSQFGISRLSEALPTLLPHAVVCPGSL